MLNRFSKDTPVHYRINITPSSTDKAFWEKAAGAVGAGPTLVKNGAASTNPEGENFFEDKILRFIQHSEVLSKKDYLKLENEVFGDMTLDEIYDNAKEHWDEK
ncbi:MAG: hypothetical protein AB1420_01500 [Bacillota bacterium]